MNTQLTSNALFSYIYIYIYFSNWILLHWILKSQSNQISTKQLQSLWSVSIPKCYNIKARACFAYLFLHFHYTFIFFFFYVLHNLQTEDVFLKGMGGGGGDSLFSPHFKTYRFAQSFFERELGTLAVRFPSFHTRSDKKPTPPRRPGVLGVPQLSQAFQKMEMASFLIRQHTLLLFI